MSNNMQPQFVRDPRDWRRGSEKDDQKKSSDREKGSDREKSSDREKGFERERSHKGGGRH
jgi:hypothetical protein